ncbi:hypothetical protein N4T20_02445 [Flavobacterium sp. TR2]|uniref:hypothetical protein n=1 Tax=Flavobacterium sp. TR2 TaxID=2977321 RepID=UPI0021B0D5EF|nr:hypothetical protein [Flavobacterium sp. TR2]UWY28790.1 hypothetical protein N4T20_02445 [Flavobacterium sp. TR2]
MKKKKVISKLINRIEKLEKIIKPDGATFTDPMDENKAVFIGIKAGKYTNDVVTITPQTTNITNITNQSI